MTTLVITESKVLKANKWQRLCKVYSSVKILSMDGAPPPSEKSPASHFEYLDTQAYIRSVFEFWDHAKTMAQNWYIRGQRDWTEYQGVSFGRIVETDIYIYILRLIEKLELIKRAIEAHTPQRIIVSTLDNSVVISLVSLLTKGRVRITCLSPAVLNRINKWRDTEYIRDKSKELCVDRHLRHAVLLLSQLRLMLQRLFRCKHYQQATRNTNVLGVLEQPGAYLADSIIPVLSHFDDSAILLMDPRHLAKSLSANKPIMFFSKYLFTWKAIPIWFRARRFFKERWKDFWISASKEVFVYNDFNLWPLIAPKIRRLFMRQFPMVAVEIEAVRHLLANHQVKGLLLTVDAHHGGRLFVAVSNKLGIPSIVIQHGVTAGEVGYVPVYATRFAAWGEYSKRWLIKKGVPPEKVIVTGQPRFDRLANFKPKISREDLCQRLDIPESHYLVLWIMDPISDAENNIVLRMLLKAISTMTSISLIIRPHPGMSRLHWLQNQIQGQAKVRISSSTFDLYDVLKAMDVIIIQQSTVGLEALLLEKPVVKFDPLTKDDLVPYAQYGAVLTANNESELREALEKLLQPQAQIMNELAEGRRRFLEAYLYAIDGNSSLRVAHALQELMIQS